MLFRWEQLPDCNLIELDLNRGGKRMEKEFSLSGYSPSITMRWGIIFLTLLLISSPGCQFVLDDGGDQATENDADSLEQSVDTDEIVLRLSDIGFGYNLSNEVNETRNGVSKNRQTEFEEKGIRRQHRRLFTREDNSRDLPEYILSSVIVYEGPAAAREDLSEAEASIEAQNGEISTVQIEDHGKVSQAVFRDSSGYYQTIVFDQQENLRYYVIVSDKNGYRPQLAQDLFAKMAEDI